MLLVLFTDLQTCGLEMLQAFRNPSVSVGFLTTHTAAPSVTHQVVYLCRAKAEKAAAAEAAHVGTDMETNMEEAERFTLPTGAEVEAVGRGPPDLALISRRIKETVRLLEGFKVLYFFRPAFCSYGCASLPPASLTFQVVKQ